MKERSIKLRSCASCSQIIQINCRNRRFWDEFPVGPANTRNEGDIWVTLSRKGEITIGAKAHLKLGLPEAAVLLYDRLNHMIGVAPCEPDAVNAFPLIKKKFGDHRVIRANLFCRHHMIYVNRTAKFTKAEIDEEGVLTLDLRSLVGIGRSQKTAAAVDRAS